MWLWVEGWSQAILSYICIGVFVMCFAENNTVRSAVSIVFLVLFIASYGIMHLGRKVGSMGLAVCAVVSLAASQVMFTTWTLSAKSTPATLWIIGSGVLVTGCALCLYHLEKVSPHPYPRYGIEALVFALFGYCYLFVDLRLNADVQYLVLTAHLCMLFQAILRNNTIRVEKRQANTENGKSIELRIPHSRTETGIIGFRAALLAPSAVIGLAAIIADVTFPII